MAANHSILSRIGNTPLVRLDKLNPNPQVELWAKLEFYNPGGSIKDRPALNMIEAAEADGRLTRDKTILEATSGNTGIGLALVAAAKGYRLLLTMAESASLERRMIVQAMGAEIKLTPAHRSTDGAIEEAYRLAREEPDKYFLVDQFNNPDNPAAHYKTTAPEIWAQTEGRITHLVASLGTSGTVMGCADWFKKHQPQVQILAMEPYFGHKIQGLKNMKESYRPGIFDKSKCDEIVHLEDNRAFDMARRLAREEGILAGMSSGASVAAAMEVCRRLDSGVVVAIVCDTGERYLSTPLFAVKKAPTFRLYNTLTRRKEPFEPLEPGRVGMYTCGPTVSGPVHIGNCRRYVVADLLKRVLEQRGFEVNHVVNVTDLSDSTISGSAAAGEELTVFTDRFINQFRHDLAALGVEPPTSLPQASEHVDDMIALTQLLLDRGYAYVKMGSVYFDISRLPSYGQLSRVDLSKIRLGKTVDLDDYEKENPRDFTLLKRTTLEELKRGLYWQTKWGNIRPSWHLECAAMASSHLGQRFDIHTSSSDLIFPHHENTLAVGRAAFGQRLANYWVHNEPITFRGHKISDDADEVTTLRDLMGRGFLGREIRYWLLATHYRKPLELTLRALQAARRSVRRLDAFARRLEQTEGSTACAELDELLFQAKTGFDEALENDLQVSQALAAVFDLIRPVNRLLDRGLISREQVAKLRDQVTEWNQILQVIDPPRAGQADPDDRAEIEALIARRDRARQERNFAEADQIRDRLNQRGIRLIDTADGTDWLREPPSGN